MDRRAPLARPRAGAAWIIIIVLTAFVRSSAALAQEQSAPRVSVTSKNPSKKQSAQAAKAEAQSASQEERERYVDRAALAAQKDAISKLDTLIRKYRGTDREPVLLMKLAEIHQQTASIHFRLAFGLAHLKKTDVNLSSHRGSMLDSIKALDTLISKFPQDSEVGRAWFMRGKAYEEINNRNAARTNYLHLVKHFPELPEAIPAYMSLATFAIDENKHADAIPYLKHVEARPDVPHFPFALYKLAWCEYNLKNIAEGMAYLVRHVRYYDAKKAAIEEESGAGALVSSDSAIRENSLMDATIFFMEGYERKIAQFHPSEALGFFKNLESGPLLGKMLARYATLLRSHAHEAELIYWKNLLIEKEAKRPETLDVVIVAYEYQMNNRQYAKVVDTARDIVKLHEINEGKAGHQEGYEKAQALLLDTAKTLQALTIKNKNATRVTELSTPLAQIYESFIKIVDSSDPRVYGAHYNLAETLFEIRQYEPATQHYRWVVEHWKQKIAIGLNIALQEISLKAIAARYNSLKERKQVPKELAVSKISDERSGKIDPLVREWVDWIDAHLDQYPKDGKTVENFGFEANRTLYAQGKIQESLERLTDFALERPTSEFAIPSASLAIDTYVRSDNWEATHKTARRFLKVKAWEKNEFNAKLFAIAADASYKLIETAFKENKFDDALDQSEDFLKTYAKSTRLEDVLFLAGEAAVKIDDKPKSEAYFSRLIQEFPNSDNAGPALLARARQQEERFELERAAADYVRYLQLSKLSPQGKFKPIPGLKEKILRILWLNGSAEALSPLLAKKEFCDDALAAQCQLYQAMLAFESDAKPEAKSQAFEQAMKAAKELRPIWAATALRSQDQMAFPDRMLLVRIIAGKWDELDPSVQLTLIPKLSASIPKAFELNRQAINKFAKIKGDEKSISHRVKLIQEMENTAGQIVKLPWARIRVLVLNEIASLYSDFSQALYDVPTPEGLPEKELAEYQETIRKLAMPFEEKGQEIRSKAFEIAGAFAVDGTAFQAVAAPYFKDNPSLAKTLQGEIPLPQARALDASSIGRFSPGDDWKSQWSDAQKRKPASMTASEFYKNPGRALRLRWIEALRSTNWRLAAHLMNEGKTRKLLEPASVVAMQVLSLAAAGAQSEALITLVESLDKLDVKHRAPALTFAILHYLNSFSKKRTRELLEKLDSMVDPGRMQRATASAEESFALVYGAEWSGAKITAPNREALLKEAASSRSRPQAEWARKQVPNTPPASQ